jgi:hypothetical protein
MSSLIGNVGLKVIEEFVKSCNCLDGDIAEVGVYKGGSADVICSVTNKHVYLFDTFKGIPFSCEHDNYCKVGDFGDTTEENVRNFLKTKGYKNFTTHKGIFPDETSSVIIDHKFCFVHLDVDVYESYKKCLEFFYSNMVKGGIILFDDYNTSFTKGSKIAVDEFFIHLPEKVTKTNYISSTYIIKQ